MFSTALLTLVIASVPTSADTFGVRSPAVLRAGGTSLYAEGGYSQVRLAFRQGIESADVGLTGEFDSLRNMIMGVGTLHTQLHAGEDATWSIDTSLGAYRIYDDRASDLSLIRSHGLAVEVGTTFSYVTDWPVAFFMQVRAPLEAPFSKGGGTRLRLLAGGGAEVQVAREI